jgi:adenosine deaminase
MKKNLLEFITKIPKSDLHVHLDGSVRLETLIDLSKREKLKLPSFTVAGLNELVFKDQYKDLVEYLQGFSYVLPIMQTPENLERISYEFALDNIKEGVCYIEPRFAPHLHVNDKQNIDQVLLSVNKGLNKAKAEYNQTPKVKSGELPEFNYGIIVCAMRSFGKGSSKFLDRFLEKHKHLTAKSICSLTSLELAKSGVAIRDKYNIPIVAFDLAGAEHGNPSIDHKEAYHFAHQNFMYSTVHAGEASGPESIQQAIAELYADRIGHGFYLFSKDAYIKKLVEYIAHKRITIEVCLSSNLQTIPALKNIKQHSFAKMLANNLSVTICTDNRTVSKTNVTKELMLAIQNFNLAKEDLKNLIVYGFKRSFYFGTYANKRSYVKNIIKRYELLEKEYEGIL